MIVTLLLYVQFINFIGEGMTDQQARKRVTKNSPYCRNTINHIIKEKLLYGKLQDGPTPRNRLSKFDKLSLEQKDLLRKTVSLVVSSVLPTLATL